MKSLLLACVLLTVVVTTQSLQWKDCGSVEGKVTKVVMQGCASVDVCPLKKGTNVSVEVSFQPSAAVDKAKAVVHGIIAGVPLPFPLDNADACKDSGLTCPLASGGSFTYKQDIFVQKSFPKVRVVVEWELKNSDGKDVFCIELPASIVD